MRDGLDREGVDVSMLDVVTGATPFTACLVGPDGDRVLLPTPGTLPPIALTESLRAALERATWLHVDHVGAAILPALRAAGLSVRVSVDGGNPIPGLALDGIDLYAPTVTALLEMTGAADIEAGLRGCSMPARRARRRDRRRPWLPRGLGGGRRGPFDPRARSAGRRARVDARRRRRVPWRPAGRAARAPAGRGRAREANAVAAASTRALDGRSALPDRAAVAALLAPEPVA